VHANALHQPSCCSAEQLPQQNAASSHVAAAAAAGAAAGAAAAAAGGGGEAAFSDCGDAGGLKKLCCRAVTALMRLSGSYAIICRNSSTCAAMVVPVVGDTACSAASRGANPLVPHLQTACIMQCARHQRLTSECNTGFSEASHDAAMCFCSPDNRCTARTDLRLEAASGQASFPRRRKYCTATFLT
jgi:hypothetical protein